MIGKKVKARREELGLTQEELAKKLGYKSKSTINKIELDKNDVSQTKLKRLAEVLEVDVTYFLKTDDQSEPPEHIAKYVDLLLRMSPEKQNQVISYINFLSKEGDEE